MENLTSEINKYIIIQNEKIWNELRQKYTFLLFHDHSEYSWKVKVEDDLATIVTPNLTVNHSSFTHELLHVYLDYLGLPKCFELMRSISGSDSFDVLIENNLISHIYNFCSHKKMFPYYKEMGFSEYDFVNERITFNDEDLNSIQQSLNNKNYTDFIGHSLALLNNVVEEDNLQVTVYLKALKELDYELYNIIERFDKNWSNSIDLNLIDIFSSFDIELDNWIKNKNSKNYRN